jgi:hypothetical protein
MKDPKQDPDPDTDPKPIEKHNPVKDPKKIIPDSHLCFVGRNVFD